MALNSDKYKKNMQDGAKATKEAAASADEFKAKYQRCFILC